jgi:hypothetical protein
MALVVRIDDGGDLSRLEAEEIAGDRLAHAHVVTVHRSQLDGAARVRPLEDGGGRELAYLRISRAQGLHDGLRRRRRRRAGEGGPDPGVVSEASAGVGNRLGHAGHGPRRRRGEPVCGPADARRAASRPPGRRAIRHRCRHPSRPLRRDMHRIRRQRKDLAAARDATPTGPLAIPPGNSARPR